MMTTLSMQKTTMMRSVDAAKSRRWYEIDATGVILGDLAVNVANLLRGKNKPTFTPNVDCGDYVIIKNADKIVLSEKKQDKEYWYRHSGYIGGIKKRSGREMIKFYSDKLIFNAVKGMLPKNKLNRKIIKKLFVYKNEGINHSAQKPITYVIKESDN